MKRNILKDKIIIISLCAAGVILFMSEAMPMSYVYYQREVTLSESVVEELLQSAWKLRNTNPEQARELALQAIEASKRYGYQEKLIKAHSFAGVTYRNEGNMEGALRHYAQGFELAYKLEHYEQMAYGYLNLGNLYLHLNEPKEARAYLTKLKGILPEINNEKIESYYYLNTGRAMLEMHEYDGAIAPLQKGLSVRYKIDDKNGQATCLKHIGDAYLGKFEFEKALEYYNKAQTVFDLNGDEHLFARLKVNMARIYIHQSLLGKARKTAMESLELGKKLPSMTIIRDANMVLSEISKKKQNYELSSIYLNNAVAYTDSVNTKVLQERLDKFNFSVEKLQFEHDQEITLLKQKQSQTIYMILLMVFFLAILLISRNVYLIKKSNKALEAKHAANEELSKVKKDLVSMIIHDLNNPLNAIMILNEMGNDSQYSDYIKQSGMGMQNLISNLLEVNRMEEKTIELSMESIHLKSRVDYAVEQVSFSITQRGHTVNNEISQNLFIEGDVQYFDRVINNLLVNAIKFCEISGKITISAKKINGSVKIFVKDNGQGIPIEWQEKVFEKSWSRGSSELGASSGLGLTFCKMVVEAHDGEIGLNSKPNEGATFWFTMLEAKSGGNIEQFTSTLNNKFELEPTDEECKILMPTIKALVECNIYEITRICLIVEDIDFDSSKHPFIAIWVKDLERAYENGNVDLFKHTIGKVKDQQEKEGSFTSLVSNL